MLVYNGSNKNIIASVKIANSLLIDVAFYMRIKEKHTFDMSNATGIDICRIIKKHRNLTITIEGVTPGWRFSKMNAVFFPARPTVIGFNTYKMNSKSIESFVGMWVHELIHVYDALETEYNFGHGSNSAKGKENTVPYFVGKMSKSFCMDNYHETPVNPKRTRKWYNPFTWF